MSVMVNQFEVVPEPEQPTRGQHAGAGAAAPEPSEVERMVEEAMRIRAARVERLRAS